MSRQNDYEPGRDSQPQHRGRHNGPGMMAAAEKPKDFKAAWGKLFAFVKPHMTLIVISLVFAVVGAVTTVVGPDMLREMTGVIMAGIAARLPIDLGEVTRIAVTLVFIYAASSLAVFIQGRIMTTVTQRLSKNLRTGISQKINRLPLRFFGSTADGNILSRVTNDVDTIGTTLNQSVPALVISVTTFAGVMFMMIKTNFIMAAAGIAATLIGLFVMTVIIKNSQKYFRRNQSVLGELNGHIEEMYAGHTVVKAYNGERAAIERFDAINAQLYDSNWKSQFFSGLMMPLMGFIGNFGYVAVCVTGALMVINERIGLEVIVAFMLYIRLFMQPLQQIAQSVTGLQSTAAAAERVFEFLGEEEMPDESGKTERLEHVRGRVSFDHVQFGYLPEKIIIRDFSVEVKAGTKVAIVGPTGAGKTTMVNLLMRFYDTNAGEIRIDGVPISRLRRENVHELFCMVLQDTWLFEGTIAENVVYSKTGVTYEDVQEACKAVGLHHFIRTLPLGYNTVLGDNVNLSAGQKQLLTIARAMVENAPLLILDEATSSVDTRTEVLVQQAMDKLTVGRTSFVIAHRLSTIRNADLILVMRDGDIIESGSHDELLAGGGFYAELYNSQFEDAS